MDATSHETRLALIVRKRPEVRGVLSEYLRSRGLTMPDSRCLDGQHELQWDLTYVVALESAWRASPDFASECLTQD